MKLDNVSLSNVNIYAAENLDRYHVQRLDVSFDTPDLIDLNENEYPIAPATVDQDAAFHHAWVLIMKPLLHNMCLEEGIKVEGYICINEFYLHSLGLSEIRRTTD